jgi:hypothetical protein
MRKKPEHDPEKCVAVLRKDHAQSKNQSAMRIPNRIALWSAKPVKSAALRTARNRCGCA